MRIRCINFSLCVCTYMCRYSYTQYTQYDSIQWVLTPFSFLLAERLPMLRWSSSVTQLFIQQIFSEHLLCARHISLPWGSRRMRQRVTGLPCVFGSGSCSLLLWAIHSFVHSFMSCICNTSAVSGAGWGLREQLSEHSRLSLSSESFMEGHIFWPNNHGNKHICSEIGWVAWSNRQSRRRIWEEGWFLQGQGQCARKGRCGCYYPHTLQMEEFWGHCLSQSVNFSEVSTFPGLLQTLGWRFWSQPPVCVYPLLKSLFAVGTKRIDKKCKILLSLVRRDFLTGVLAENKFSTFSQNASVLGIPLFAVNNVLIVTLPHMHTTVLAAVVKGFAFW